MKIVDPPLRYQSIEAFYADADDALRRHSAELDFGVHWTEPHEVGWTFPRSRLTWVENTGELIVVRTSMLFRRDPQSPAAVKVIAVVEGRDAIESVLEGWALRCKSEGLGWVYHQLKQATNRRKKLSRGRGRG